MPSFSGATAESSQPSQLSGSPGTWEMTQYPGAEHAAPAVDVRGSRLFPLMKVYRRLTIGEEEDLPSFYSMVTERLGNPAKVN